MAKPKTTGRAAGSGSHYQLTVVDKDGNPRGPRIGLPSVTTILGALPKNGLDWWGFKLGCAAALQLSGETGTLPQGLDELYDVAKKTDHAPHRALKAAGNRGTNVHDLAEKLLTTGELADEDFSYGSALNRWYQDKGIADLEIVAVEVPLWSLKHGYAGTCDFIARDPATDTYIVGDHKSAKAVYESHLLQTAAYAEAARELGLIPEGADVLQLVIRLGVDGEYEEVESHCTIDDFMCVKRVWELLRTTKGEKR